MVRKRDSACSIGSSAISWNLHIPCKTFPGFEVKMKDGNSCPLQNEECAVCIAQNSAEITRRSFFASLLGASAGLIAAIIGMPMFRYILYPVQAVSRSDKWTEIGDVSEFDNLNTPVTKTISLVQRDGWREVVSNQSVFVSRSGNGMLQVLSPVCPHLGCSVSWHENQNKFICPCHGGQFAADGKRLSGPPPRGLDTLDVQIKDGKLQVQFEYFRSNVPDRQLLS
jgi:menaquinol-cytochrome c reductase iron-sulfur subunit